MKDAAKKRRRYLAAKAAAKMGSGIGTSVFCLFAALAIVFLGLSSDTLVRWVFFVFSLISAVIALAGWRVRIASVRRAHRILYVPPVREQIAALPADELLLRGANQPDAQPGELLRASRATEEKHTEELVRPAENRST